MQSELVDVAQDLFARDGYEAVTIDQIAAAAGMSKRSFFRYFPSKDALVLGKYDREGERFAAALAARPVSESPWEALRRMFDHTVAYISDPELARRANELMQVIDGSSTLRAGYLERMERAQQTVVTVLRQHSGDRLSTLESSALVAAAFAAIAAAHTHSLATGEDLASALDQAMLAIANGTAR